MPVFVQRRAPRSPALDARRVRELGEIMLHELGLAEAELSVLLTSDPNIQRLNHRHRGKNRPTDVLAFPLDDAPHDNDGQRLLGDVVISLDSALRQARSRRRDLFAEVRFLLAHGLLHLVGYDHATLSQKKLMDRMTRQLVRAAATGRAARRPRPSTPLPAAAPEAGSPPKRARQALARKK